MEVENNYVQSMNIQTTLLSLGESVMKVQNKYSIQPIIVKHNFDGDISHKSLYYNMDSHIPQATSGLMQAGIASVLPVVTQSPVTRL